MLCERLDLDINYLSIIEEKVFWNLEADVNCLNDGHSHLNLVIGWGT